MIAMENAGSQSGEALSFFQRIDGIYSSLTAKQAAIADHLRSNYREAVFYTLAEAAAATGASDASVIRFARMLGYGGFSAMQDAMRSYVAESMRSTVDRFQSMEAATGGAAAGWERLIDQSVRTLQGLPYLVASASVKEFASTIGGYSSVMVVGFESTAGFAEYLAYYLARAGFAVETISEKAGNLFPYVRKAGADTLVISIMVARYPKRAIDFCLACKARGSTLAVVSDTADHPLARDIAFQFSVATRRSGAMNLEIQVALFAALQMIILEAGMRDVERTRAALAELEDYDTDFGVFS
jgi:DNA-binding MurR/RpiR family transcriptional regulator